MTARFGRKAGGAVFLFKGVRVKAWMTDLGVIVIEAETINELRQMEMCADEEVVIERYGERCIVICLKKDQLYYGDRHLPERPSGPSLPWWRQFLPGWLPGFSKT